MYGRIIKRNLTRNKAVTLASTLFLCAAAALLSLAAVLTVNLSGAVDRLMAEARTPHFMQMHKGEPGLSELERFAREHAEVEAFQVLEFLNLDNSRILLGGHSLSDSVQDNGICTQSGRFDFLLDLQNKRIQPQKGELYVPVSYLQDGVVKAGDPASINGRPFTVAGFVRDSQMNSSLASSKRFVVNEADYRFLRPFGSPEYLIEFRLREQADPGAFEASYSAAGLPSNGPALTWPLFRMVNAVSDGILIAVLVLSGILVILIALLCIRFMLLARIEDDTREIGVMIAVGMRIRDIKRIYLAIYGAMAAVGCFSGFLLSLFLQGPLETGIRLRFGQGGGRMPAMLLGFAATAALFCFFLFSINRLLRRFRKISAVEALRFGPRPETSGNSGILRLSQNRLFSVNLLLGFRDILARKRLYATMLMVASLAAFLMIVPQNLYHTVSGDGFISYLGVGSCDLRMDLQPAETDGTQHAAGVQNTARAGTQGAAGTQHAAGTQGAAGTQHAAGTQGAAGTQHAAGTQDGTAGNWGEAIDAYMNADPRIRKHGLFTTKILPVKTAGGGTENCKVELGDHTVFPLRYAEGRMPLTDREIALSALLSQELEKELGETVTLFTGQEEKRLTICGIYSDITNGGKTAKASFAADDAPTAWSMICADLADSADGAETLKRYAALFPGAKVTSIADYTAQTFGPTLRSVRLASFAAILAAAAVTFLVTFLFIGLLAAKDRFPIAVMRALGYTASDISRQYEWRAVLVTGAGILSGTVLAGTLGEQLAGMALSSFGTVSFQFQTDPLFTCLLSPGILLLTALLAASCGAGGAGRLRLQEAVKE